MRSRTADILITSEVLYQLSYGGPSQKVSNIVSFYLAVYDFLILPIVSRPLAFADTQNSLPQIDSLHENN